MEKKRDWKEEKRGEEERLQRKRKDHDKSAATTDSDTETEDEIRYLPESDCRGVLTNSDYVRRAIVLQV